MLFLQKGTSHGWAVAAGRDKKLTLRSQKHSCLGRAVYQHQQNTVAATNFANDISWCGELAEWEWLLYWDYNKKRGDFSNKNESSHRSAGQKTRLSSAVPHSLWRLRGRSSLSSLSAGGAQHPGAWSCPALVTVHVFAWLSTVCLYQ